MRALARRIRRALGRRRGVDTAEQIAQSGAYWDQWSGGAPEEAPNYWLEIPIVRRRFNNRMKPGATTDYVNLFFDFLGEVREQGPRRALSVGCGTGGLERNIAQRFPECEVIGIDVSRSCLAQARSDAESAGLTSISYVEADGVSYLDSVEEPFDAIFCHGVLHHMEELEAFLERSKARLREDGFMFVYEYVGPSRDEWADKDLCWAQRLFEKVPPEHRRLPEVYPPLALEDPTEMIRSSEIEDLIRRWYSVDRYWPLGGNVVVPLVASLQRGSHEEAAVHRVIEDALDLETFLLDRELIHSHFSAYYCLPLKENYSQEDMR